MLTKLNDVIYILYHICSGRSKIQFCYVIQCYDQLHIATYYSRYLIYSDMSTIVDILNAYMKIHI